MSFFCHPGDNSLKLILKETFRELIDENLNHIIGEVHKYKCPRDESSLLYTESCYELKKRMRKEIAEECREAIDREIENAKAYCMPFNLTIDKILKIIRGE